MILYIFISMVFREHSKSLMDFLLIYLYKAVNLLQFHEYTDINKRQKTFNEMAALHFEIKKKKHHIKNQSVTRHVNIKESHQ